MSELSKLQQLQHGVALSLLIYILTFKVISIPKSEIFKKNIEQDGQMDRQGESYTSHVRV